MCVCDGSVLVYLIKPPIYRTKCIFFSDGRPSCFSSLGFLLIEFVEVFGQVGQAGCARSRVVFLDGTRRILAEIQFVVFALFKLALALGSAEEVDILLLWEVNIIVSVRVRELGGHISVVLVKCVRSNFVTVRPVPEVQIGDGAAAVVVRDFHCSFVSLVVNRLGSESPLFALLELVKNVVGAHLHNADLLVEALLGSLGLRTLLELLDLSDAAFGGVLRQEGHVLGVLHDRRTQRTLLVTEGLVLAVGVPIVVRLNMSLVFVESVVEVTVEPVELRDDAKEERHLNVVVAVVVVLSSQGVQLFVSARVDDCIAKVVRWLLVIVFGHYRTVEIVSHFNYYKLTSSFLLKTQPI